jgi:PadR family transcriptional regulator, regulatory protein AphA
LARILSTTANALLGLIAVQPGSAYELAKRMETNYRYYWPRAESKLYEEVKRLRELGLVDASDESTGRRARTVYRINDAGLEAFSTWLAQPGQGPVLEFEALLKVHYGDFGSQGMLIAQLESIRDEAAAKLDLGEQLARTYQDGQIELPQRAPVLALVWRFLWDQYRAHQAWADWALVEVSRWEHTLPDRSNLQRARNIFREAPGIEAIRKARVRN